MKNLCSACQEEPRMVLPSGKLGKMCAGCQKDHDDNMRTEQTRFCKHCRTNKPSKDFAGHSRVCVSCQAAAKQPVKTEIKRVCTRCQDEKPITDFSRQGRFAKPICKTCFASDKETIKAAALAPQISQPHLVIVDRARGQILRCRALSEIPFGAKRLEHLVEFYERQGCRIVDAIERVPEAHHGSA